MLPTELSCIMLPTELSCLMLPTELSCLMLPTELSCLMLPTELSCLMLPTELSCLMLPTELSCIVKDVIRTNVLTNFHENHIMINSPPLFHENWTINLTLRVKMTPPGYHVFNKPEKCKAMFFKHTEQFLNLSKSSKIGTNLLSFMKIGQ
ncbi:hypothetical protein DPMN_179204 [Dreissena polymorpha]|uniref:Uncharacterized protein n=1 Tax=Dreissena polymorpha TaxID=45954 RepID=A0A9D4IJD0_DREPO|nr:hypothetical protein DPMN_179204 [Dreissena polymorpha]